MRLPLPRKSHLFTLHMVVCCMRAFIIFLFLLLSAHLSPAQDDRAKLTVRVTDPAGASVPGASLVLTRGSTGTTTMAQTGSDGTFTFLFLEPDSYAVRGTAPGLSNVEVRNIVLGAYGATGTDLHLTVASADTQVTVTSSGAVLQTENAARAWNLDAQQIQNLPVPNNNPLTLGNDIPGVYLRPLGAYTEPWTVTSQFLINGGLMGLNEFQLDGNPNDAQLGNNVYGYAPPNFAVKEFSVSANSYDAQYGHTSGGVINLGTISGGDKVHGMAWGYFRRPGWNANTYQNNFIGTGRPPNSQDQFGGQVGGPFIIPHLIPRDSRVKPFYFASVDRYIERLPNSLQLSYPELDMRAGDFSKLRDASGNPITIYDPASGHYDSTGAFVRNPFPNNIIPANRINPIAAAVTKLLPAPNLVSSNQRYGQVDYSLPNNYFNWHFYNVLGRFDFNIGDKYKFFIRPYISKFTELSDDNGITGPGGSGGNFSRFNRGFLIDFVDALNPTTVLNIRYGYTLYREQWLNPQNSGYDLTSLGLPANFVASLQQPALFGQWTFEQYATLGWFQSLNDTGTRSIESNIEKSLGKHNLRFGEDVRLTHYTVYSPNEPFTFNFQSDWTRSVWNDPSSETSSGDSFASFLLGTPSSGNSFQNVTNFYSSWYVAPWIQDDWKVNQSLTVNLGLRYDILVPPTERHNQLNVGFNPSAPSAAQGSVAAATAQQYPQLANLTGAVEFAGVNGNGTRPFSTNFGDIQPRFGFAYAATPQLVFRGGYGLFYTNFQSNDILQDLGFSSTTNVNVSPDNQHTQFPNVLNNPLPNGSIAAAGAAGGSATYLDQGFTYYNPSYHIPTANEFSFGLQLRTTNSSVLDISFVGNRVRNYSLTNNQNLPAWSFAQQCDEIYANGKNSICSDTVTNPFQGASVFQGTNLGTSSTISLFDINRPHPQFVDINEEGVNRAKNWYNALQVDWSQRLSHGLAFNTSYVWSKQIEQYGYLNQYLGIPQRSPYLFNLPQSFKINGTYELPFGRGKLLSFNNNRIADKLLSGWTFGPDFTLQSGEPEPLPANAIPLRNSFVHKVNWRTNVVKGWGNCVLSKDVNGVTTPEPYSVAEGCTTYDWLAVPTLENEQAEPTFSSAIRSQPMLITDAALEKNFKFERFNLLFRAQATNAINHFNLLNLKFDTNPADPLFGTLTRSLASPLDELPRNIQLGVRGSF